MFGYGDTITIEVVTGGFVLTYPLNKKDTSDMREVFNSSRKLNQKLKEIIDTLSTVTEEKPTE